MIGSEAGPDGPVLEAHDVHRFYRRGGRVDAEVAALRGVDLVVHAGETVAVIGPSGSGKSTLLGLLAGLDDPDGGSVRVAGERLSHRTPADQARLRGRLIGVVTQASGLVDHLDVLQNVLLAGSLRRSSNGGVEQARALLYAVGLSSRSRSRPATLSGGETARANLAAALIGDPVLLLADEPTAEISRAEEATVLALLREHRPAGAGAVLVTHSAEVARSADRVVELQDGRVVPTSGRSAA
ncbi:MAG: ABC transporter ATP-binding protein [Mycobacteriales bacterium]